MAEASKKADHRNKCEVESCLYYKHRNAFHRHHFLWAVVIATVVIVGVFVLLVCQYNRNQERIVALHAKSCTELQAIVSESIVVKDSCFYINDLVLQQVEASQQNVSQLLELQFNKLQSDFTILSLWASALMIIFLVFSIYSVFKTDELMKQSRDVLQHADEASNKVDQKMEMLNERMEQETEKATQNLNDKTNAELEKIKAEINNTTQSFKDLTEQKAKEYGVKYQNYLNELTKANENSLKVIDLFIERIRSSDSDSKTSKNE